MHVAPDLTQVRGHIAKGDWPAADAACEEVLAATPGAPTGLLLRAIIDQQLGRQQAAEHGLRRLSELLPDVAEPRGQLVDLLYGQGRLGEAAEALEGLLALAPDNRVAWIRAMQLGVALGRQDLVEASLTELRALAPADPHPARIAGVLADARRRRANAGPHDERTVLLVSDMPRQREAKLAAALKSVGLSPVLLYKTPPAYDTSTYFAAAEAYQDGWDALERAGKYRASIHHVFCQMDYSTLTAFLLARPGKVVADCYDQISGVISEHFLALEPNRRIDAGVERAALPRADGIVARNLETQYLKRHLRLPFPPPRLYFPEYCWGDIAGQRKLSEEDGELHVVYGGTVWLEQRFPDADFGFLWLGRLLAGYGIHLHVYPGNVPAERFEQDLRDYRELEQQTSFFHLHGPIGDNREFLAELSRYDVGLLVSRSHLESGRTSQYSAWKYRYCYANKFPDYMDAGLLAVINAENFCFKLARRLGVALPANDEIFQPNFWQKVRRCLPEVKSRIPAGRARWDLAANAPRLADFYRSLTRPREVA